MSVYARVCVCVYGGGRWYLLFHGIIVCFSLTFRHITDAALAIVKGETVPLDVLQIKGEKEQPVFAMTGLRWGSFRDAGVRVSK